MQDSGSWTGMTESCLSLTLASESQWVGALQAPSQRSVTVSYFFDNGTEPVSVCKALYPHHTKVHQNQWLFCTSCPEVCHYWWMLYCTQTRRKRENACFQQSSSCSNWKSQSRITHVYHTTYASMHLIGVTCLLIFQWEVWWLCLKTWPRFVLMTCIRKRWNKCIYYSPD